VLWCLGYPEQALHKSREALRLAQEQAHPFSLAWVLCCAAWLYQCRQELQKSQKYAEAAITLCHEQGFQFWLVWGTSLHGWALTMQGQGEKGIAQIREGLTAYQSTGAEWSRTYFLALLADALGQVGHPEEGLSVLAEALEFVERRGERVYEAEIYRLKGKLLLAQKGNTQKFERLNPHSEILASESEVEACFLSAIAIAQKQQAKSLELRAVMSLVRLRQWQAAQEESRSTVHTSRPTHHESRAKLGEAHRMLAEVYHWFTEGFDTKDLQEAKALLEELSH
jgi:predicted ATPase